jgi:hypothetical protein
MDALIDDFIVGMNWFTQELPYEAEKWINDTVLKTDDVLRLTFSNSANSLMRSINFIVDAAEDAMNKAIQWANDQTGHNTVRPISIAHLQLDIPDITNWDLYLPRGLPPGALDVLRIPEREFSVYQKLAPFVDEVFDITVTIAIYCTIIAVLMLIYAALRLVFALLLPFIPRAGCGDCAENCIRCLTACAKAHMNVAKELVKPWIHVPLIIGLIMTFVSLFFLFVAIDEIDQGIRIPIKETDKLVIKLFTEINEVSEQLPILVNRGINELQDQVVNEALLTALDGIDFILQALANRFRSVETIINDVLSLMSVPGINIDDYIDAASIGLNNLNLDVIPRIPLVPTDLLRIPLDCCSIETAMSPWIDDRMQELRDVAFVLLWISVTLAGLPTAKLIAVFVHPFIPHSVNEFFTHPDWNTEADEPGNGEDHHELKDSPADSPVKSPNDNALQHIP